jgi:hypothetical protein
MKTLLKTVLLALALGAVLSPVAAQPPQPSSSVFVTNDQDNPVPITDVENPARRAYQGTATITTNSNGNDTSTNFAPAPIGGRLVIEYVSAACATNLDTRITQLGVRTTLDSLTVQHNVVPVTLPSSTGTRRHVAGQPARLYHDSNSTLSPFRVVTIAASGLKVLNCTFAVSGHIVAP